MFFALFSKHGSLASRRAFSSSELPNFLVRVTFLLKRFTFFVAVALEFFPVYLFTTQMPEQQVWSE